MIFYTDIQYSIKLYVAFFIFAYSVYFIYLLFTGRHSTQVHELEAVEKSMKDFADVSKSFVKSEIENATKALSTEIEALKSQLKELKEENGNPDGEDDNLDDKPAEKSDNVIDVTKFFNKVGHSTVDQFEYRTKNGNLVFYRRNIISPDAGERLF